MLAWGSRMRLALLVVFAARATLAGEEMTETGTCAYPDLKSLTFCDKYVGRDGGYSTRCGGERLTKIADNAAKRLFERLAGSLAAHQGLGGSAPPRVEDPDCREALIASSCAAVFPRCDATAKAAGMKGIPHGEYLCHGRAPGLSPTDDEVEDPIISEAAASHTLGSSGSGGGRGGDSDRRGTGGIAVRGDPPPHDSLLRGQLAGVCKSMCYEIAAKCGLSPYRCRLAWSMPSSPPCTSFDMVPQVGCRTPFSQSLGFCSGVRHPVLAAPFATDGTWTKVDTDAEAAYDRLSGQNDGGSGDTDMCRVSIKNYVCSLALPRCHESSNTAVPMCRSACTAVKAKCGREAPMDCSDDRVFADESTCSMYLKEPGADRAAVAGLVAVLVIAVGAVMVLFIRQFYYGQNRRGGGYQRVSGDDTGTEMGSSALL